MKRFILLITFILFTSQNLLANTQATAVFFNESVTSHQIDTLLAQAPGEYFPEYKLLIIELPVDTLKSLPHINHIGMITGGTEELDTSTAAINLRKLPLTPIDIARPYPESTQTASSWWTAGFRGQNTVTGLLDSGIAAELPSFKHKRVIQYKDSPIYRRYTNGVRTPHGTGVGSILSAKAYGQPYLGVAHDSEIIVFAHAWDSTMECTDPDGVVNDTPCVIGTLNSLLWMLDQRDKPNVVNYSFGHGPLIDDYSPLARIFDQIIEQERVLIIKSAGNDGYITPGIIDGQYANTLSTPADFYNGITVANINTTLEKHTATDGEYLSLLIKTAHRNKHHINYTSSRGPTPSGRRKPDLAAPGNDTRVYAPDPAVYVNPDNEYFSDYSPSMHYRKLDSTRLMGGTSSAAPHVAGAVLLLASARITDPLAARALLINSASAWQPESTENPCDSSSAQCPSGPINIPEWDPIFGYWDQTYGWGYIDLEKAYQQRKNIITNILSPDSNTHVYYGELKPYEKATLVWEKHSDHELTPLRFTIETADTQGKRWQQSDPSLIDNVKQLINKDNKTRRFKITVSKPFHSPNERYALVTGSAFK